MGYLSFCVKGINENYINLVFLLILSCQAGGEEGEVGAAFYS